jgi:hypothetical protein
VRGNPRQTVTTYDTDHELNDGTFPSLPTLVRDISVTNGSLAKIMPAKHRFILAIKFIQLGKGPPSRLCGEISATEPTNDYGLQVSNDAPASVKLPTPRPDCKSHGMGAHVAAAMVISGSVYWL